MRCLTSVILFSLFFLELSASGQVGFRYSREAEEIFREGVARFASEDFEGAYAKFSELLAVFPKNQRTSAAYVMGAKALYRLKEFEKSIQLIEEFFRVQASSRYLADAHFTLATDYYALGRYDQSLAEFLKVLELSQDMALSEKSAHFLDFLGEKYMSGKALKPFFDRTRSPSARVILGSTLAQKWVAEGRTNEARSILVSLVQQYPNSPYAAGARSLLNKLERVKIIKVGVVLPLFSKSSDPAVKLIGEEIRRGIEFAAEEFQGQGIAVELVVLDSEGDPTIAASAVSTLTKDREIIAIIGPIYSAEVTAASQIANERGVPLVTPTANANGLASVGPYIFQANPDYSIRGKAMARYALEQLGLRSFAVLAPIDSYGRFMAESFMEETSRLGAKIFGIEWYEKGATDFEQQLMRLRKAARLELAEPLVSFSRKIPAADIQKLLARGVSRQILDSLIASRGKISVFALLGLDGKRIADSLHIQTEKEVSDIDTLEIPIEAIDAFYLPIASSEEIGILSAQLAYYNFKTQLLGSGDWYNPDQLDANRRYTDGVIFDSDTYADPADTTYLNFYDRFLQRTNTRPTKNTLLGYDATRLVLTALAQSLNSSLGPPNSETVSREKLAVVLSNFSGFRGLHSLISFNRGRVNAALNILQYKSGAVKKLGDVIVQED